MSISEEQRASFIEAANPLIKWLNDNIHPHAKVIVECDGAELVEGLLSHPTTEFIKD